MGSLLLAGNVSNLKEIGLHYVKKKELSPKLPYQAE